MSRCTRLTAAATTPATGAAPAPTGLSRVTTGRRPGRAPVWRGVAVAAVATAVSVLAAAPALAATGSWSSTGSLGASRTDATATRLPDGSVLVVGGTSTGTAEVWHPTTGRWQTVGSPAVATNGGTSAVLLGTGKVLVVGGCTPGHCPSVTTDAELYDPATGTWSTTGHTTTTHGYATITRLGSGKVLLAGGCSGRLCGKPNSSAELYDPATGQWAVTGSLGAEAGGVSPVRASAVLLASGQVLLAGGFTSYATSQLYDPTTGTWRRTAPMGTPRESFTLTRLGSGAVLAAGGCESSYCQTVLRSAEVFDPTTGTWTATADMAHARVQPAASLLPTGGVLVTGGMETAGVPASSAETYDATAHAWSPAPSMHVARASQTSTVLTDGRVLVAGGGTTAAEVFTAR